MVKIVLQCIVISCIILFSVGEISAQYLTTSGENIVDKNNNPILLRGVGLGGWMLQEPYMMKVVGGARNQQEFKSKLEGLIGEERTQEFFDSWLQNFVTEQDVDSIASWGFNSIRLPMHYNLFTLPIQQENGNENTWLDKGFDIVDNLLSWCEKNELYLILDLHAAPGGQGYDEAISDYDPNYPSLWESDLNKQKTVALWGKLAERYKNEEWIGGYDILNETNWNLSGNEIKELYVQITNAIRVHDQNHILFIEGNWFANDFTGLTPPWDNNMVYSFHKYWNENTQAPIQWVLDMRAQYDVPLWMGESGENSNVWFKDAISLFEDNNIGWAWWPWKRLDTTVSSYSIKTNSNYNNVVNYFKGEAAIPDKDSAFQGMMDIASASNIDNCDFRKDVVDAMLRQPSSDELVPFSENTVPGIILATHFDMGSQGLAYYDTEYGNYSSSGGTSSWNLGWVFRNDGVDISTDNSGSSDSNGYSVGYVRDREWMKYTLDIKQEGYYDIETKYSALNAGGKIQFEINDVHITHQRALGTTGSFSKFNSVTSSTSFLETGKQVLKVRVVGDVEFNLESFNLTLSANQTPNFSHIGAIIDKNDKQVRLVLNKDISSTSVDPESFQLLSNGEAVNITSATIDNSNSRVILLNVENALSFYDIITIGYSGNSIISNDNQRLTSFSIYPVENVIKITHLIPSKIEAEDYDFQNGINTEETTDVGLGVNIKDLTTNDYATYEVDVQGSANYLFQYRVATERANASFSISFTQEDDVVFSQSYSFSGTGGWQTWKTLEDEIYLDDGKYVLTFRVLGDEFNLNWLNFELINNDDRLAIPGIIEAENYDTQFGLVRSSTSDTGGGQELGYLDNNDYATYAVRVESEGAYKVKSRVATAYDDAQFLLELEKSDGLIYHVALVEPSNTGSWSTWKTIEQQANLPEGNYTLKMTSLNSATNLNWYEFEYVSEEMQSVSVPAKMEVENYHAYFGVGTEDCSDTGQGRNLNYIDAGDYTRYLISVSQTGYYNIKLRVAGYNSGMVNLVLSSPDAADESLHTFTTPQTGGWQVWETIQTEVLMQKGDYTLTLNFIEGSFNMNWIDFVYDEDGGIQVPGLVQAEDFWDQFGLSTESCTDDGGGENLSYMDQGDYSKYLINVTKTAKYNVKARVASQFGGGEFNLVLSGEEEEDLTISGFQISNTGGWQNWETIEKEFDLAEGVYELTMNVLESQFNLNWIEFEEVNEEESEDTEEPEQEIIKMISIFPNPTSDILNIESTIAFRYVEVRGLYGRLIYQETINDKNKHEINTPFPNGIYFLTIKNDKNTIISTKKFIRKD